MADESVFRAVAHPARRRVLDMLRDRDRPVAEIVASFRLSRPAVSQHLRILRTSGLVRQRRNGRSRVYTLVSGRLRPVHQWITAYRRLSP
jgi:DNA-binding transcriptional ArsR family regulator